MRYLTHILCWCIFAGTLVSNLGCYRNTNEPAPIKNDDASVSSSSRPKGETLFTRLMPGDTGIDFQIVWDKPAKFDRVFYSQNTGGGVCVGDYDGDRLADIYLTRPSHGNRLYKNQGNLKFEDVTKAAGLEDGSFWGTGASFVDIDNDGDLDIYACGYDCPNRMYINHGDGTFSNFAKKIRLDYHGASVMMAFADYDCDGDLDGYLVTAGLPPGPNQKFGVLFEGNKPVIPEPLKEYWQLLYLPGERAKQIEAGQYDHLYRNDGPGSDGLPRFTDVTKTSGIEGTDLGQAATWWDYDSDGHPDLYVANDYWGSDKLYHNNGDGTFTDVAQSSLPHTPWSSMGVDVADINGDGLFDFMATDMAGSNHFRQKVGMGDMNNSGWFLEYAEPRQYSRNTLYLNTGTPRFMEAGFMTGLDASDWTWSPRFADFDNDGLIDVIITNGMTREFTNSDLNEIAKQQAKEGTPEFFAFWRKQDFRRDQNLAFRNKGNVEFEDVSKKWGFDRSGVSFGSATGDLDGDGDLDVVVNNMDEPAYIYRNETTGNSIQIALHGQASNRFGVGAVVRAMVQGVTQVRYLTLSRGWNSTSEPMVHFGLGSADSIDRLEIDWPNGSRQIVKSLKANQIHHIVEKSFERTKQPSRRTMFVPSQALQNAQPHIEVSFDDFKRQPLLPNKSSQLGPSIASADINGDGWIDLFLGGASNQPAQLMLNTGAGEFKKANVPAFDADAKHEDMGALFFDADGDGDRDLYVVSGSVECAAEDLLLEDRLYKNDGHGKFTRDVFAISGARDSGSCVCAADFDRDGDLDLFVGGRIVPGQYPVSPKSRLLQNDNGSFRDVTEELATDLFQAGMVTSAVWSDVDSDHWIDLLVTYEWGPIRLFRNDSGKLIDHTESSQLQKYTGWWNGISSSDLDADGDIDFVVSNFGLNTKYHASDKHPAQIYYGDFGNGQMRIVEAEHEGEMLFPVRGKSCSTNAMPFLATRFKTFTQFGLAELDKIYTNQCLEKALTYAANTLETGIFINRGDCRFEFRPLPRMAQISPSFATTLTDVDLDGDDDLFLVQNFYSPQRETGHMDGGVGMLFLNDGQANFEMVWPNQSGIVVPGDGKCGIALDVNNDGKQDLLVGVNNGAWLAFQNNLPKSGKAVPLTLMGSTGNPDAIGASVHLEFSNGTSRCFEVNAGSGYLSQSSSTIVVALPSGTTVTNVRVQWPNGSATSQQSFPDADGAIRQE